MGSGSAAAKDHPLSAPADRGCDKAPSAWICDTCGQDVSADDGAVSSRIPSTGAFLVADFRIVHAAGCRPPGADVVTTDVRSHLGADGLSLLLAYLSAGPGRAGETGVAISDIDSFVDLVRRLQIPHYEQARRRFDEPGVAALLRRGDRWTPYRPSSLRQLLTPDDCV